MDKVDKRSISFKRLAERRVNKTLDNIRLIGNLSNRNNYLYTDKEVDKILKTLSSSLDELAGCFKKNKTTSFKL